MLDNATAASKEARKEGKPYGIFTKGMEASIKEEEEITSHMSKALSSGEFEVYYQPKYDLKSDKVAGAEGLVRWFSPTLGNISPGVFIPIFEKNGFVAILDQFVWEETCKFLASTMKDGKDPLPISINISKVEVYSIDVVDRLTKLVDKYGIQPKYLCLEITESVFIDDIDTFNDVADRLKEKGFLIFMDDFGSGYSSLNVLKDMEVDVLKIDMRFFSFTKNSKKSNSIVENVIRLAHSIGVSVIAEGVETQDQADFLRLVNCDFIQGFVFSKAIDKNAYFTMISKPSFPKALSSFNLSLIWDEDTRGIFDSSLQAFCLVKTSSSSNVVDYVYTNASYDKMFGHAISNTRDTIRSGILPDYRDEIVSTFKKCHDTKANTHCECLVIMPDGKIRWISILARLVYEKDDWDVILCSFNDITAIKTLKNELDNRIIKDIPLHLSSLIISANPQVLTDISSMMVSNFETISASKNADDAIKKIEANRDNLTVVIVDLSMSKDYFAKLKGVFAYEKKGSYKVLALIHNKECQDLLVSELNYFDDFFLYPLTKKMLLLRLQNDLNIALKFDDNK